MTDGSVTCTVHMQYHYLSCYIGIYRIAGYIGGNNVWRIARKERKLQLVDINLVVAVQSPRLLWGSTQLAQYWQIYYWRCDKSSPIHQIFPAIISGYTVHV